MNMVRCMTLRLRRRCIVWIPQKCWIVLLHASWCHSRKHFQGCATGFFALAQKCNPKLIWSSLLIHGPRVNCKGAFFIVERWDCNIWWEAEKVTWVRVLSICMSSFQTNLENPPWLAPFTVLKVPFLAPLFHVSDKLANLLGNGPNSCTLNLKWNFPGLFLALLNNGILLSTYIWCLQF